MSTPTTPTESQKNFRTKKVVVPKVWKRPHSTIYGKNVEFGSKLYSDKLGEINGRKFNSELPWQVRNSGASSSSSSSNTGSGYLSNLLSSPETTLIGSVLSKSSRGGYSGYAAPAADYSSSSSSIISPSTLNECTNYADVLDITNPYRYSKRRQMAVAALNAARANREKGRKPDRIDFYDRYMDPFERDVRQMSDNSVLLHEPLLNRRAFDKYLDFNHDIGLFVSNNKDTSTNNNNLDRNKNQASFSSYRESNQSPLSSSSGSSSRNRLISNSLGGSGGSLYADDYEGARRGASMQHVQFEDDGRSLIYKRTLNRPNAAAAAVAKVSGHDGDRSLNNATTNSLAYNDPDDLANQTSSTTFAPICTTTLQTKLLPNHHCQLPSSPYGQSADGRKLSLGSINPHSYRPSLPSKTSTVHASDGEEFEFQDKSSPFYTDRNEI